MADAARATEKQGWLAATSVYFRKSVIVVFILGFSSGLPLALTGSTLQVWMRESGVDLRTIGVFALVAMPYSLKFLWAPLVDALNVPILGKLLGRRRGWLVLSQLFLIATTILLAFANPAQSPFYVALGALLLAFASATQDIVVDAFRVESLNKEEQPAGQGSYVAAYRIGMLISTAGALYLVTGFEDFGADKLTAWRYGYLSMAVLVLVGIAAALWAEEPAQSKAAAREFSAGESPMKRVFKAAFAAFADFLSRNFAILILIFIVLFKLCDAFAGQMTTPFVLDLGFSRNDYATVVKIGGFAAIVTGGIVGGLVARAYPLATSLWIAIIIQMASNLVFTWQAYMGLNYGALFVTISVENFTGAIGTVIFVVYLSALCQSPLHTATQFALLSALASVGRIYISSVTGYVAEWSGWPLFFVISALMALPAVALLAWLQAQGHFRSLEQKS